MDKSNGRLIVAAVVIFLFVFAGLLGPYLLVDRTGRALIGKPVVKSIRTFLAPKDLKGRSFILLSDMYVDECNDRQNEFHNLIVNLRDEGTSARMLHIGSHGFPSKSYQDAVSSKRAPTHIIVADKTVAYANSSVRWLSKPCVVELNDGEVVSIRVGEDFDRWSQD